MHSPGLLTPEAMVRADPDHEGDRRADIDRDKRGATLKSLVRQTRGLFRVDLWGVPSSAALEAAAAAGQRL